MGTKLLLTSLATAWLAAIVVAFFWLGLYVAATYAADGAAGYWIAAWMPFAGLAAAPFIVFAMAAN